MSKSLIFLVNHFGATFEDIWRSFSGHTAGAALGISYTSLPQNVDRWRGRGKHLRLR